MMIHKKSQAEKEKKRGVMEGRGGKNG